MSESAKKLSKSSKDLVHAAAEVFSPAEVQVEEFFDEDNRPIWIDSVLLNSVAYCCIRFTSKGIWGIKLQASNDTTEGIRYGWNCLSPTPLPPIEHMAFVARASLGQEYIYFIAQFGRGDYIPTEEERRNDGNKFKAVVVERNLRHAALCLVTNKDQTEVWVKQPVLDGEGNILRDLEMVDGPKILVHPGASLVADEHDPSLWTEMNNHLTLPQLNEMMFATSNVGKKYQAMTNDCQTFAKSMFKLAS